MDKQDLIEWVTRTLHAGESPTRMVTEFVGESVFGQTPEESVAYLNRKLADQYRIVEVLGMGGMGTVYRARSLRLDRDVAIKAIHFGHRLSQTMTALLRDEAMIVANLQHPNIKQVYDVIEVDQQPLIVMEYIEGINLEQAVRGGDMNHALVVQILLSICEAVGFAHSYGVIHRDIKPSNIIITVDGNPKLADFGIALKLADDGEAAPGPARGKIMGSPAFMSPEQARGDLRQTDVRADVYSLGATLYFCLTGRPPFTGSPDEILRKLKEEEVEPPSDFRAVPPELESIALRCLQKIPAERYRTTYMLADDLMAFLEGRPVRAHRYDFLLRARRAIRHKKEHFTLAVAAALLVFLGIFSAHYFDYRAARRAVLREVQDKLTSIASMGTALVQPEWVAAILSPADRNSETCRQLVAALKRIKQLSSGIQYVYIMRESGRAGLLEFVVEDSFFDSLEELDLNRNGILEAREKPVDIGQIYPETPLFPEMMRAFQRAGADADIRQIDRWGIALSGYAPIVEAGGRAIAILGVDISPEKLRESFEPIESGFLGAISRSALLLVALLMFIVLWTIGLWERPIPPRKRAGYFARFAQSLVRKNAPPP